MSSVLGSLISRTKTTGECMNLRPCGEENVTADDKGLGSTRSLVISCGEEAWWAKNPDINLSPSV